MQARQRGFALPGGPPDPWYFPKDRTLLDGEACQHRLKREPISPGWGSRFSIASSARMRSRTLHQLLYCLKFGLRFARVESIIRHW